MSSYLIEYMKLHLVSIEQDQEYVQEQMQDIDMDSQEFKELDSEFVWLGGQIIATRHFIKIGEERERDERQSTETD
jgi:hypothetical protein